MTTLSIVRPGLFTTVQDLGRWGYQSRGVPVSGAMDQYSHRLANRLVGNRDSAATLEATLTGPQIVFEEDTAFAVAGAVFGLTLGVGTIDMNRRIDAKAGSVLTFGERQRGARSYIAIAGGVDVPLVLGSRSTHVLTRMGGLGGRALRAGDRLTRGGKGTGVFLPSASSQKDSRPLSWAQGGARLRVLPGEDALFAHLAAQRFRISPRSDRMGYRLEGTGSDPLTRNGRGSDPGIISGAVATGTIQIPPAGQPILLLADRATTGGYAIGGTVITADLPAAGQLAPGDWVEFEACSIEAADEALRDQEAVLGRF